MNTLRIALAQINMTVGDFPGNAQKIKQFLAQAKKSQASLVLFPELAVTGYPPEDLLFKPSFIRENLKRIHSLAAAAQGIISVVGFVDSDKSGNLYNAAAVCAQGRLVGRAYKLKLPNYGVFDEKRYFIPGKYPLLVDLQGTVSARLGISICEDIWAEDGPCRYEAQAGAAILLNISASPYDARKRSERESLLIRRAQNYKSWVVYLNLVGGQDELVFDGGSMVVSPSGKIFFRAPQFEEGLFLVDVPIEAELKSRSAGNIPVISILSRAAAKRKVKASPSSRPLSPEEEVFRALVLGTKDYVLKNGFSHVVVGLSGGIDSALTAAVAAAALGPKKVTGVSMPSRYSSSGTKNDAGTVAKNLRIKFMEISIEQVFQPFLDMLKGPFGDRAMDVTEENLQARIRGILLMALSNKFHWLVLSTGNKSELSTGYCTLYGDMVGGFAVIKDVPKTLVYRLSRYVNRYFKQVVIPESVLKRFPTAELRPNQTDQQTLPPYSRLDALIKAAVEDNRPLDHMVRRLKIPRQEAVRVMRMIDLSEYKRRQAPVGIKITPRAFGKDRRMPITNKYTQGSWTQSF